MMKKPKINARKKTTKPATVARPKARRTSTRPGGIDLLQIANAVRVPDVRPEQGRESGPTVALFNKTIPSGQNAKEETMTVRFINTVVHVNGDGEQIAPAETKERGERKLSPAEAAEFKKWAKNTDKGQGHHEKD
jgi:hypothetical protein